PEQWDPIPQFVERKVYKENNAVEAWLKYPDHNFEYMIRAEPQGADIKISVNIDSPVPAALEGRMGFNLEFLPAAYFEKTYIMDDNAGTFPLYPSGPMEILPSGKTEPLPLAKGQKLVLAPEDPERRITISSSQNELALFDGRNKAQNGWFVVRSV